MRLVSRLTTEFSIMNLHLSLQLVPGDLAASIIAQVFLRGALPHLIEADGLALPVSTPMIGSASAVARSLQRPPETVRRIVQALAGQGFFVVDHNGVRLAPSPEAGTRILAYLWGLHDNFLWLVEELDSWGLVTRPAPKAQEAPGLELTLRTALDLRLFSYESFKGAMGGWTGLAIWLALSAASVRHITTSRQLSGRFSQRSTPDALRRPISVRALCAFCGLPYATVWRHLAALEKAGSVGRKGEGYVMLTGQLLTDEIEARVALHVRLTLDRVNGLVARGMYPTMIPSLYFGDRPTLVPMQRAMPGDGDRLAS